MNCPKQLLDHASAMEKHYGKVRHALDKKEPDNVLKPLLKQADDISAFVAKAQALIGGNHRVCMDLIYVFYPK